MSVKDFIFGNFNRLLIFLIIIASALIIPYLTVYQNYKIGVLISVLPFALVFFYLIFKNPKWGFFFLFILNYYISGLSRYFPSIPPGIVMDVFFFLLLVALLLNQFKVPPKILFKDGLNAITLMASVWMIYLIFQLFNPYLSSSIAWLTYVRGFGTYFVLTAFVVSVIMRRYKDLQTLLTLWAILCLTAVLKAFIQKYVGFDSAESRWLADLGRNTHIISSGIRYFSFFTDAANFGTGIAFSGVVFAIVSIYQKNKLKKIFFFLTAIACFAGMVISGTRGSLLVIFVGFTMFVVLSKKLKLAIPTAIIIVVAFAFLKYTYIGHGNQYIRRMRSVFNTEDASLLVRLENQAKFKEYMVDKPFGAGIGMSRGRAEYRSDSFLSSIPKDSWYVLVWVETGIVGLILHVTILMSILGYGCFVVLFRLKNEELRGIIAAFTSGIAGLYVASYTLELMGQFPNGIIMYTFMTFIFLSPLYDKELMSDKQSTVLLK